MPHVDGSPRVGEHITDGPNEYEITHRGGAPRDLIYVREVVGDARSRYERAIPLHLLTYDANGRTWRPIGSQHPGPPLSWP